MPDCQSVPHQTLLVIHHICHTGSLRHSPFRNPHISSSAHLQSGSVRLADLLTLSPDNASYSDSEPELFDPAAGGECDFNPAAKSGRARVFRPFLGSKVNLKEKNKRAQKRLRDKKKVLLEAPHPHPDCPSLPGPSPFSSSSFPVIGQRETWAGHELVKSCLTS